MYLNSYQKTCLWFFIALVVFWGALFVTRTTEGMYNYLYSFLFGLIPLFAGIIGIVISMKTWGGFNSSVGKAVFFVSLGILCWGAGETIWSYYNFFLGVAAPYPSIADIGFAPSIFFYGLGAFYLSSATGARFALKSTTAKIGTFIGSVLLCAFAYYILVVVARGGVLLPEGDTGLKGVLDIAYPLGDLIGLVLAAVISGLSFKYLGGMYKYASYAILAGLFVMFVGDSIFSYTTTAGTYYNGDFGDLILMLGVSLLSFGVLGFAKPKDA